MFEILKGGISKDFRGQIRFVNNFDLSEVKRFYLIKNADVDFKRGWRGHKIEKRWFFTVSGTFILRLVEIDNWENPSPNLPIIEITLSAINNEVLFVPPGYAMLFQACEIQSEILVFSDNFIENAPLDDYSYDVEYFTKYSSKFSMVK